MDQELGITGERAYGILVASRPGGVATGPTGLSVPSQQSNALNRLIGVRKGARRRGSHWTVKHRRLKVEDGLGKEMPDGRNSVADAEGGISLVKQEQADPLVASSVKQETTASGLVVSETVPVTREAAPVLDNDVEVLLPRKRRKLDGNLSSFKDLAFSSPSNHRDRASAQHTPPGLVYPDDDIDDDSVADTSNEVEFVKVIQTQRKSSPAASHNQAAREEADHERVRVKVEGQRIVLTLPSRPNHLASPSLPVDGGNTKSSKKRAAHPPSSPPPSTSESAVPKLPRRKRRVVSNTDAGPVIEESGPVHAPMKSAVVAAHDQVVIATPVNLVYSGATDKVSHDAASSSSPVKQEQQTSTVGALDKQKSVEVGEAPVKSPVSADKKGKGRGVPARKGPDPRAAEQTSRIIWRKTVPFNVDNVDQQILQTTTAADASAQHVLARSASVNEYTWDPQTMPPNYKRYLASNRVSSPTSGTSPNPATSRPALSRQPSLTPSNRSVLAASESISRPPPNQASVAREQAPTTPLTATRPLPSASSTSVDSFLAQQTSFQLPFPPYTEPIAVPGNFEDQPRGLPGVMSGSTNPLGSSFSVFSLPVQESHIIPSNLPPPLPPPPSNLLKDAELLLSRHADATITITRYLESCGNDFASQVARWRAACDAEHARGMRLQQDFKALQDAHAALQHAHVSRLEQKDMSERARQDSDAREMQVRLERDQARAECEQLRRQVALVKTERDQSLADVRRTKTEWERVRIERDKLIAELDQARMDAPPPRQKGPGMQIDGMDDKIHVSMELEEAKARLAAVTTQRDQALEQCAQMKSCLNSVTSVVKMPPEILKTCSTTR
ncbi:hypothetical protein FISHEDRAFT_70386 [Fistulina hepatica ATCC 64428]|uniref:Uncharacterized protein n=1 Tax=Fistulina hepatica ATCC 64428 TaxID=1128425 RepID=A0A0D7AJ53_9AGAR|nr:hypothetical protein FISHEDRAFT_70386 [Fistulina hepatica ATCC 64428]